MKPVLPDIPHCIDANCSLLSRYCSNNSPYFPKKGIRQSTRPGCSHGSVV